MAKIISLINKSRRWRRLHWRRNAAPGLLVLVAISGTLGLNHLRGPKRIDVEPQLTERAGNRLSARAIDGDTIELTATGERIRLANIDTPETGERARCAAESRAAEQAKREANALLRSGAISVRRTRRTDAYGRTIAYVSIAGRDLGHMMIERGLARPWRGRREPWCGASGQLLTG
jgi:endonuclease YncB( thermonuclease family)